LTEVPEHLLRRSQERRAALGLGGGGAGGASSESAAPSDAAAAPAAAEAASSEVAPAPAAVATAPVVEDVEVYVPPPAPARRIPLWVYPVLAVLPLWVFVYFGAYGTRESGPVDPLVLGAEVFQTAGCAGCHGANGQGQGDFPALNNGDTLKTFPNVQDHINWVKTGSAPFKGKPYGDPNREGGQRIAKLGQMPPFAGSLTEAQIEAVVQYEREGL
jgi:mono/diheme cytochrome c family protein